MPALLCIETSSPVCSVAVSYNNKISFLESQKIQAHAETLADLVNTCIELSGIQMRDLQAIAISEGPGSYTGLRIGVSLAKGLCFALNIPMISISTLKIIASAALKQQDTPGLIWPMIDARRMEVYHAVFDRQLNLLTPVTNGIITEPGFRPAIADQSTYICGDGAGKAEHILGLTYLPVSLDASHMAALAIEAYDKKTFADLGTFEPFYLKQANITSSRS